MMMKQPRTQLANPIRRAKTAKTVDRGVSLSWSPPHNSSISGWRWFWRFGDNREDVDASSRSRRVRRRRLEAILFIAREPLNGRKLAQLADLKNGTEARTLIRRLNQHYQRTGRSFRVEQVAGGYQLLTRPEFAGWLRRLSNQSQSTGLSSPALETLAVVAYQQPILRAEIESVRGVSCGELLRQLMDRNLVRISGRSEDLGRPFLYSTTRQFLSTFGLNSLDDLPQSEAMLRSASEDNLDPVVVDLDRQKVANPSQEDAEVTLTQWHPNGIEEVEDLNSTSQGVILEIEDEENYAYVDDDDDDDDDSLTEEDYDSYDDDDEDDDDFDDSEDEDEDEDDDQWEEVEGDDDDDDEDGDYDDFGDDDDFEDDEENWDDEEGGDWDDDDDAGEDEVDNDDDDDDEEWS
jgi:segregation and condensation protein B